MVDVDYYVDFNAYLCYGNPIIIYSFVPQTAGGPVMDGVFSITDSVVSYCVAGGASYKHRLWDHSGSHVSVVDKRGYLITYSVEQFIVDGCPERRIIGYFPINYANPGAFVRPDKLGIQRRNFGKDMNILRDPINNMISLSTPGSTVSVTIPSDLFEAIKIRHRRAVKPVIADVERLLQSANIEGSSIKAPILFNIMSSYTTDKEVHATIFKTSSVPVSFQTTSPLTTEDGRCPGRAVAPPIVTNPGLIPVRSFNNDTATIQGRVTNVANNTTTPLIWNKYDEELLTFLVPKPGIGVPYTIEHVIELQDRPAQRNRSAQAVTALTGQYVNKVKAFIKAEAYNAATDPRNISTVDNNHQLMYSCYTYPLKEDLLKGKPWFASSMTPDQITDRLGEICDHDSGTIIRDYSRLDGHVSRDEKLFKNRVYMRWCRLENREQLQRILQQDLNPRGVTSNGLKYDPGYSQLSGSPGTTNDNNIVTIRHDYIALRELGNTPQEAWSIINKWFLGASDDRICPNFSGLLEKLEYVTKTLGHVLKNVVLEKHSPIPYLGRIFPDPVLYRSSFQDPYRTLGKLHLTVSPVTTSDVDALRNKALGYYTSDPLTPIIGPWCAKVLALTGISGVEPTREEAYKIKMGPWPQDNVAIIRDTFAAILEMTNSEVDDIETAICRADDVSDLPNQVLDNGHLVSHKIAAVVGEDLVGPMPAVISTTTAISTTTTKKKKKTCHSLPTISPTSSNHVTTGSPVSRVTLSRPPSPLPQGTPTISRTGLSRGLSMSSVSSCASQHSSTVTPDARRPQLQTKTTTTTTTATKSPSFKFPARPQAQGAAFLHPIDRCRNPQQHHLHVKRQRTTNSQQAQVQWTGSGPAPQAAPAKN